MGNSRRATTPRLRVGICGGGIAGLVLAVALSKYPDIEVTVYEAASKLTEVGAGVGIFPRPWEIIRKLDLEEDLLKATEIKRQEGPVRTFVYRKSDSPEGMEFYTLVTQGTLMVFHRSDFQQVLLRHLASSCRTYCGKRLRTYTQRPLEPIKLYFEDGSTATCDVLVGADGIKSVVRQTMMTEKAHLAQSEGRRAEAAECLASIDPMWSGNSSYRALIPAERLRAQHPNHRVFTQPMQYLGKDAHIIAYPISRGKLINFVAFVSQPHKENTRFNGPWVSQVGSEEMAARFRKWEPEVQALIHCVDQPLRWVIHTVRPLTTFAHGRIAVIGDAAHAMLPTQGSGAGQGIEDAFILATVLGNPKTDASMASIQRALKVFDVVRRPRAQEVQERSRLNENYFSLNYRDVDFSSLRDEKLYARLVELMETVKQNWAWTWSTSPRDIYEEATALMES
ncbi:Salicylate hydroxylase [Leucoagaricus sp. SymC.cos]|nr:Salicylate hydroxylase [Leucoagaricus sp. SymC.cos]